MTVYVRGDALREYMIRRNITTEQFAKMVGTPRSYMYALIGGHNEPRCKTRLRLMEVTGLGFDDLFAIRRDSRDVQDLRDGEVAGRNA